LIIGDSTTMVPLAIISTIRQQGRHCHLVVRGKNDDNDNWQAI